MRIAPFGKNKTIHDREIIHIIQVSIRRDSTVFNVKILNDCATNNEMIASSPAKLFNINFLDCYFYAIVVKISSGNEGQKVYNLKFPCLI